MSSAVRSGLKPVEVVEYEDAVEKVAFEAFRDFIAGGIGTCRLKRDQDGKVIRDLSGRAVQETPAEAALRRWNQAPRVTQLEFRDEALSALVQAGVLPLEALELSVIWRKAA